MWSIYDRPTDRPTDRRTDLGGDERKHDVHGSLALNIDQFLRKELPNEHDALLGNIAHHDGDVVEQALLEQVDDLRGCGRERGGRHTQTYRHTHAD